MEFDRTRKRPREVNLTALIDIVFHLMVFVMLTTTFVVSESMELALPNGAAAKASPAGNIMRIVLIGDGTITVDGVSATGDEANTALVEKLGRDPETSIAVFTTEGVKVQQLVGVMDMVYLAGGHNVQVDKVR